MLATPGLAAMQSSRYAACRRPVPQRLRSSKPTRSASSAVCMFGPAGSGGFLNLGAPEVVIIGAVAWVLLGPKELYKLARQAGEFLGEWQQLGRQAQATFKDALDQELGDDAKVSKDPPRPLRSSQGVDSLPSLSEFGEMRQNLQESSVASAVQPAAPDMKELYQTFGEPEKNRDNFMEQVSGERNKQVMQEWPTEMSSLDTVDGVQVAEEELIETRIAQAENELAALRAEAQVLELRRKQQEANAERARLLSAEPANNGLAEGSTSG
eukprot:CAMPEP_0119329348 /NCGR_PEP_ID=MMETSP1333-20130426/75626_1 /TAXON_ID=418940 /ORGANISM="Scyphosphaera apsteinii, Strain RCC1455" /LENGTH=267 /DNA_ID=CAMNT_0007338445 /DNA_START=94 /DNA_END=897 /DNA_ORIENTATION=+